MAFNPEKYYEIEATFDNFDAKLDSYNDTKVEIKSEEEAKDILSKLSDKLVEEDTDGFGDNIQYE